MLGWCEAPPQHLVIYKNHLQIFVDRSIKNEKVVSRAFFPPLNIAMGERMYDNVSIMSVKLNAIILIAKLENIIVYSESLSSQELLFSDS